MSILIKENHRQKILHSVYNSIERNNKENVNKNIVFQLLDYSPYSLDLATSNCRLSVDLKRMIHGKRFSFIKLVIAEVEAYFESINKSFYRKANEKYEERWKVNVSLLKVTMLTNKVEFTMCIIG